MLKLGRKVGYGLIALLHVAELEGDELATCREIAEAHNIPPELLGKVLQTLKKAGLVLSIQGVKGGYRLERPLTEIPVGEVIEALDGPLQIIPCDCETYECDQEFKCNIKSPIIQLQQQLQDFIYELSLASLQGDLLPGISKIPDGKKGHPRVSDPRQFVQQR